MDDRKYLISILISAREQVAQAAQKAVRALDEVVKAQDRNVTASQKANAEIGKQIGALKQLVDAHTREKKALEDSAAIFRFRAAQRRAEADASRKQLEEMRKQRILEKSLADERKALAEEELARIKQVIAQREAEAAQQERDFKRQTDQMRKQASLIESLGRDAAAANRRQAAELDLTIAEILASIDELEEEQKKAERENVKRLRDQSRLAKAEAAERERRDIEEVRALRLVIAEREEAASSQERLHQEEIQRLREQAEVAEAAGNKEAATHKRRAAQGAAEIARIAQETAERNRAARAAEQLAGREETALSRISSAIDRQVKTLDGLRRRYVENDASGRGFGNMLGHLGLRSRDASNNLHGLTSELRGFAVAAAIKYAQSLISVLVALGAQLLAVASAAVQAGAALAGAFTAGVAQAIPVITVSIAAFARLAAVLKAVQLRNDQRLTASQDAQAAARRQRTAAESIRSAEEQVQDAQRASVQSQQELTRTRSDAAREEVRAQQEVDRARKDAIRTVQDLMAAEEEARLKAEGAADDVLGAQAALRAAIRSGDVGAAANAERNLREARLGKRQADVGVTRAREDAAPVRARGVEGVDAVRDAEQRLADTRRNNARQIAAASKAVADASRQEDRATADLNRTRKAAAEDLKTETAAANKLADSLKLLSPVERELYERILALQTVYRRAMRPITDIIVASFTDVVERITTLLQDERILNGFRIVAEAVADSIRSLLGELTNRRSIRFFELITGEASNNLPRVTRIILSLYRIARNIVEAALPAFRLLLRYIDSYATKAEKASDGSKGLQDFFTTGIRYADAFFRLALAIVNLFLALAGPGGAAAEGADTINALTEKIDALTSKVEANGDKIRSFIASTQEPFFAILSVIAKIGAAMIEVFSASSVTTFADFLNKIVIPALVNVIEIMGVLVTVFHQLLALPGVAQFIQFLATMLLLAKGLIIMRVAVAGIAAILPTFVALFGPWGLAILAVVAALAMLNRRFHFMGPVLRALGKAFSWLWDQIKGGAEAVYEWFRDVWNQGLLKWIRWPFVYIIKKADWKGFFDLVLSAARAVINFFRGTSSEWSLIGNLLSAPFKIATSAIELMFKLLKTIIVVFLDLLAGRFGHAGDTIKDFWDDLIHTISGGVSGMLEILGKLFNALGKIPKLGKPFQMAGDAINKARDGLEEWRSGFEDSDLPIDKATDAVETFGSTVSKTSDGVVTDSEKMSEAVKKSMQTVQKQTSLSEQAFKDLADGGRVHLQDIREVARINMSRIRGDLGDKSREAKDALADNFRQAAAAVKDQMDKGRISARAGMRAIRGFLAKELQVYGLSLGQARNIMKGTNEGATYGDPDNNQGREGGASRAMAGGGYVSGYGGWPRDDHMVLDPYGRPSAMLSGNEGIVNPPQMARINQWGAIVKGLGMDSYGSLDDLWGMRGGGSLGGHSSKLRRFAGGGQIVPVPGFPGERAARSILDEIAWVHRKFGLTLTDAYGQGHKSPGHTITGTSADFSGADRAMDRAVAALVSKGFRVGYDGRFGSQNWPDHGPSTKTPNFHLHVDFGSRTGNIGSGGANGFGTTAKRIPRTRIVGGGDVGRFAQRSIALARVGAQQLLNAASDSFAGGPAVSGGRSVAAMPADTNVVAAFRRAIATTKAGPKPRLALWEAGIVESGLRNLNYGDRDSLGALQLRAGLHGRNLALNPLGSALAFLRRGFTGRGGAISVAARNPRFSAGQVAQAVQGSAFPHRYDQVRSRAMRYMRGGGMLNGVPRLASGSPPARGILAPVKGSKSSALAPISQLAVILEIVNEEFKEIASTLSGLATGPLRRSKNLAKRITAAFSKVTEDGGMLDQMRMAVEAVATAGAIALQKAQFSVGADGPRRNFAAPATLAQANLRILQTTGVGLGEEREAIQSASRAAERSLREAKRRNDKKAIAAAQAAITNLRVRLDENTAAIAQNAQDQVEAIESYQEELVTAVNDQAERTKTTLDQEGRRARALGVELDPNKVIDRQAAAIRTQMDGLRGVLGQAMASGNTDLADRIRAQIEELDVQTAELVAQRFQNSVDAVNTAASKDMTRLDRQQRRASIGGATNFSMLGTILSARQDVLGTQRAGLAGLLNQASAAGNIAAVEDLTSQIEELDISMAENTQAIKDNTNAAFNDTTSRINERADFASGIFGGAQSFFQALGQRTGIDTLPQQLSALSGIASTLLTQQGGLLNQIASLTGQDGRGLTGPDLVNWLMSIATGPTFEAIMSTLDPTQQQAFKDLLSGLLSNVQALEQNTQAISDLTGSNAQSFSSSFWTGFRQAVFDGNRALLPQYAMTIPTAATGARVLTSGALMVHAGEDVVPARISRDWGDDRSGDTFITNVTSPTEVLDPVWHNRQLAFLRKTSGR